jgi:small subunit ribosomal protein S6
MNIECNDEALRQLHDGFRYNDAVIRDLIIKRNKAVTDPSPLARSKEEEEQEGQGEQEVQEVQEVQEDQEQDETVGSAPSADEEESPDFEAGAPAAADTPDAATDTVAGDETKTEAES